MRQLSDDVSAYTHEVTAERMANVGVATPRILKRVEALFATMPVAVPEFDHYTPAYWLQQHPELWDHNAGEATASLERFEQAFKAVNSLLT